MNKLITASSLNPDIENESFDLPVPTQCPICSIAYFDKPLAAYYIESETFLGGHETNIYAIYFCPHCEHVFLVQYSSSGHSAYYGRHRTGYITHVYPSPSGKTNFTDHIKNLSPKFIEIYHQSEEAEHIGLTEICGMGYRKALEFLVKDFAIYSHPDKQTEIESPKMILSKCIADYIDSEKIKVMAKASSWIGNDETHYSHTHEKYNVKDLKRFINTTAAFIEFELNLADASYLLSSE